MKGIREVGGGGASAVRTMFWRRHGAPARGRSTAHRRAALVALATHGAGSAPDGGRLQGAAAAVAWCGGGGLGAERQRLRRRLVDWS